MKTLAQMSADERAAYFAKKRSDAKVEKENDLKKNAAWLLEDIHDESLADPRIERDPGLTVARTMARFAALQVVLSRDADRVAQTNIRIQDRLIVLTVAILILTAVMLTFQIVQFANTASAPVATSQK